MADDAHEAPSGLFEGTVFEGGLFGTAHADHEQHPLGSYEYFAHNTKFGHFIFEYMAEWGVSRALSLWITFIGLLFILGFEIPSLSLFSLEWLAGTSPVWLPVVLVIAS